jgi:1,4-dihydroxy-2-naphthoate polyprenyltransferase
MSTRAVALDRDPWTLIRAWIALQELPKHLANILPFLLGTVLAYWAAGTLDWAVLGVSLLAVFLLTNGTYIANEYFDYESDVANDARIGGAHRVGVTTTGGTRVLVHGLIPRRHALYAAIACFLLAIPVGLYLQLRMGTGPLTVPLGAVALFIGWYYIAPPIRASYRGFGELFIAVGQGLVIFGAYYVQQGSSMLPLLVSLPWFVALPALKILRQFPDHDADAATGKRGLTVIYGRERMARVYAVLIAIAILLFIPIAGVLPAPLMLLVLAPVALLARSMLIMASGAWTDPRRLETAVASGFIGMLLIPLNLAAAFMIHILMR